MNWRHGLLVAALGLVASACGVAPQLSGSPSVSVDTPALRAAKAAAHIQTCPTTTAQPTGQLPKAALPCLGGGPSVSLASLRGPMVINVWAQYCGPCRAEMPHLEAFAKKYAGRVAVLGVDYQDFQPDVAIAFAKSVGATYPLVADFAPVIHTNVLPETILLDANGKIAYQQPIALTSEAELEQLVSQHLGVKP
ncbi:MAG: TlpA family protein disulfide reductase [Marmoricola sp.]